jgi:hypothetical protein
VAGAARDAGRALPRGASGALHGIGHETDHLNRRYEIDRTIAAFIRSIAHNDQNLKNYAQAARQGRVL